MANIERQFIRHPTDIPLEFSVSSSKEKFKVKDLAEGGLCFVCQQGIRTGERVHICIPICDPKFDAVGIVKWCKQEGSTYLVGVAFQRESLTYAVRMVEQICHIENYRKQCELEHNISLSSEQAALEWISKYAADFPNPNS